MKTRTWTLPAILGIALGVLGLLALVELVPQVTVSPQEPIEKSQPFSVPFRLSNGGYLSFHVEHVFYYASEITIGENHLKGTTFHIPDWNNFELDRGQSKTIIPHLIETSVLPSTADIAIILDIRPFHWFPWSLRRYFRFTGVFVNDNWQWLAQPPEPIEANADREIEEHMKEIPSSR